MLKGETVVERQCNYKPNVQFIASIRGLYFTMNYLGIWPRADSGYGYNLVWYVQSIGLMFFSFGLTAGLILQRPDPSKIINIVSNVISTIVICLKWAIFSKHKGTIETLFNFIEQDWINLEKDNLMNQSVPDSKRIMKTYSQSAKIFFYTYLTMMIVALINYTCDSLEARKSHDIDTNLDRLLPIPYSWYPLDYSRSINIQFLAVTQIFTGISVILVNASVDCFFVTVTSHVSGQFSILRCVYGIVGHLSIRRYLNPRTIFYCLRDFIEGIKYDSSTPEYCTTKVRLMVEHHQEILRFTDHLQEMYSFIILAQLSACTLTICFLGYSFIAEMEGNDHASVTALLKLGSVCGANLLTIFCYCFAGDFLTNQSMAIAIAVYNAEWYNFTRSIRLSFLSVMTRAGRPVEMTGAKLLPMSLESFIVLMKAAASYLSVLRAVGVGEG